jgi:hypothetical protein
MVRFGRRLTLACSIVAAGCVAVAIAYGAIPGAGAVIQGCYDSGGNLKVVNALPCPKSYTALSWNQQGVKGDTGATGATGKDGINGINGVDGTNGTDGTNGAPGAAGTSDVYHATKGPAVTLAGTLLSVSVPAGNYLVVATAAVLNLDGDPQTATCSRVGGFSTDVRLGGVGDGAVFNDVPIVDTVGLALPGTIAIECHGFAIVSGEARLTATKVTALHP